MEESLPEHLQAQLDEVHALHYIFYPATVQCRGGIAAEMFAEDLMPPEEYLELLSRLTIRTRLELYAESVEGTPPESLLKVGFRVSPYTGDFSHSTKRPQSFIEVTFPAEYPAVLPRIAIMMNMSLAEQSKAELVSRLNRAVRDTQGGICVFNVAISLNEVLSDIHAKQYRLWDEATSETLDIDHHQATSFESSTSVQRLYSLDNPKLHRVFSSTRLTSDKPTATPDHPTAGGRPDNAEMLPQSHRNSASSAHEASTVDREMYSSSFDIAGWSLQSLIQSPLWYETGRRSLEEGQRETSSRFLVRQGSTFRGDERHWPPFGLPVQAHRTWSNEFESQADTTDVGTDNTSALPSELGRASSCLPIPREVRAEACSLDTETLLTISRSMALIDFLASLSSVERYRQDFTETMTILQNSFSSFVKAQHMLDQNLYMVRTYTLPNFCVLETQHADFEPKDDIERFGARRKSIIHQLVSSVALLARLQHNSIARYYQCWVEKVQQFDVISQLLRRGEALLEGDHRALSGEDGDPDSLSHWVQYLLLNNSSLRDEASVAEFIMGEAVTRRRMYIQMEHCDGTSLDQVIQHDSLYKNPQRIWTFTRHLLDVLAYLHSNNAYHQALSLKNIIVYTDAAGTGVKVCEFGIARLLRQFCYTGFFCQHAHCACREYSRQLRRELFAYHPSTFGVGDPVNFADQLALQVVSDYDAQQEDMFALGVLIFRMWHPPIEERPFKELFTSVIATKKFPQYFLQSTPEIIVSTIVRLVSAERRPTAVELLSETLVPPVMNSDLYKQYLRRLQNPLSDEAVDALRFLFRRGWKSDVTRLRSEVPLGSLPTLSFVIDGLELFMRRRSVVVGPPPVFHPVAPDADSESGVVVLDEGNTVLGLPRSLLRSLQELLKRTPPNPYALSLRRFCVGNVFDGVACRLSAVLSCGLALDGDLSPTQSSRGAKRVPRHAALLGSADMRVVAAECEVMCTAVESLESLGLWKAVTLVVHFPPLVIDFLALAFGTDVERAHAVYTSIGAVDINQYTLRRLVEELGVHESPGEDDLLERVAELLRRRSLLPVALYGIHALVMRATCGSAGPFSDMFEQLREEIAGLLPRGYTHCAAGASDSIVLSKCAKIASGASTSSPASHAQQEQYVRRMGHMLALAKLLRSLDHQESFYMESISSSHAVELCEGSIDFPSFSCYVGADRAEELAVVGGTFVGESGRLQCYAEYLVAALLSCHRLAVGYGGSLGPNSVDVVVTCQSSKLLPAAASVSCRLIDAGISCECRALPLIHTDHFNERLRQAGGVKFRVHLQGSGGSGSGLESCGLPSSTESLSGERSTDEDEAGDAPADLRSAESWHSHQRSSIRDAAAPVRRHERQGAASALESETAPDADAFSKKAAAGAPMDYDDDRTFSGVSFQVEPLRECYGQPRKIDSGAALVRYMKALLSRDGQ